MKQGVLIYDGDSGRMDIYYGDGMSYGGLHCGECLEVYADGGWIPTRIEYGNDWYLSGIKNPQYLVGLKVRI